MAGDRGTLGCLSGCQGCNYRNTIVLKDTVCCQNKKPVSRVFVFTCVPVKGLKVHQFPERMGMFVPVALQTKPRYWQRRREGFVFALLVSLRLGIWRNPGRSRREDGLPRGAVWVPGPWAGSVGAAPEVMAMSHL